MAPALLRLTRKNTVFYSLDIWRKLWEPLRVSGSLFRESLAGFHTPGSGSGVVAQRPATLWTVAYRLGDSFRGLWWTKALGKTGL